MDKKELVSFIKEMNSSFIRVAVTDIDGILRGKLMHKDKVLKSLESSFGFCNVIFGWDSRDDLYAHDSVTGWSTGFPDAQASLDPSTFRVLPWVGDTPMLLADFQPSISAVCPRSILKKIANEAKELGFEASFAMEFEWFNFKKEAKSPVSDGMFGYSLLRSSQFHEYWKQVFEGLEAAQIPIEGLHTETGPGAMEAALKRANALEAADRAVFFKSFIKEISSQHDILSSFMAKGNADLPGCSGHMHQSLWNGDSNIFEEENGKMSKIQEHYLAGLLHGLPELMPVYAPTINSYKRLVPGSWAPTTVSWGVENRTTALRIIKSSSEQSRIELRVPGSDNNPYLSMAAALASGLYGIKNELKLDLKEVKGNAYENKELAKLPSSLKEAVGKMKDSTLANKLLGESFVSHFVMTREWEILQHERSVSSWEIDRYFEGI